MVYSPVKLVPVVHVQFDDQTENLVIIVVQDWCLHLHEKPYIVSSKKKKLN